MSYHEITYNAKARQILAGAREVFLEAGFEGASTDKIAQRAGVSKGTMYSYFPDKRVLFTAFIEQLFQEQAQRIFEIKAQPGQVEATLRTIAESYITFILSPQYQDLFRIIVAESLRFPDLGRAFYDSGPGVGTRRLANFIGAAAARGELNVDDPDLAAHQFVELCKSELFYKCLFGVKRRVSQPERAQIIDATVTMFMRAYGPGLA